MTSIMQGDKIRLRGRGVTKQLRRIFSEMNIPTEQRRHIPVLRDGEGVLWVYGIGVAERAAVNADTERLIIISAE